MRTPKPYAFQVVNISAEFRRKMEYKAMNASDTYMCMDILKRTENMNLTYVDDHLASSSSH